MARFLLLICICCLFSCKSVKHVTEQRDIPGITEGKLFKNIYSNSLEYNTLYAKKVDISFDQNGKSINLKASLKIKRDSFIWVSVTIPLGIEVARILLTPDSIRFMDLFGKKYFAADYDYFYNKFDIRIGYDCFQNLLTNTFFNFEDCGGYNLKDKKYKFEKTDTDYLLSNLQEKALGRKIKKLFKKRRKNKDFTLILQKIHIDPESFRPIKLSMEDIDEHMGISADYHDFVTHQGKVFPEKIVLNLFSDELNFKLNFKFTKLDFDVDVKPVFKVPAKYKRIH